MGKSRTWTYSLKFKCVSDRKYSNQEWRVRGGRLTGPGFGAPTTKNIDAWVSGFEASMLDGVNRHLGLDQVTEAYIVDQRTGDVVARWDRKTARPDQPKFQILVTSKNF